MGKRSKEQIRLRYKLYLLAIFLLPASFVLFQYTMQFSMGVFITSVMKSLSINAIGASVLVSSYYYIYVLMQAPAGVLATRFGPRILLTIGAVVTGLGTLLFAHADSLGIAVTGRICMGFGMSCAFVSALFLYRNWFSTRVFAFLISLLESLVIIFTIIINISVAHLAHLLGWRTLVVIISCIAFGFAILHWCIIRNSRERKGRLRPLTNKSPSFSFVKDLKALFTNKRVVLNGLYCGMLMSPQTVFVALWGIPFLVHVYGFSTVRATVSVSMVFLGVALSGPLTGSLYTKTTRHSAFFVVNAILTAALLAMAIFVKMPFFMLLATFFLIGVTSSVYLWNYAMSQEYTPNVATSTSIGVTNMLAMLMAPILQLIISFILHVASHSHMMAGASNFHLSDYQVSLGILPILILFSGIFGSVLGLPKDSYLLADIKSRKQS